MPVSNIDELLMGGQGNSQQPPTPEHEEQQTLEKEPIEEVESETNDYEEDESEINPIEEDESVEREEGEKGEEGESPLSPKKEIEVDEYGNEKERMTKGMKDRLDRKEKQHQREIEQREYEIQALRSQLSQTGASKEVQQAAKDFEYNPEESGDWQTQLASFVKQTVNSMQRETQDNEARHKEATIQREFEAKFKAGIGKFDDFVDVISGLNFEISNPMTLATRGMDNPAAFLYAAAKRNPAELERISKLRDPYAQMTEMGKLEERMRKNRAVTKAAPPLKAPSGDMSEKVAPKYNIDHAIHSHAKRRAGR